MTTVIQYISEWWYNPTGSLKNNPEGSELQTDKTIPSNNYLITEKDLLSAKLVIPPNTTEPLTSYLPGPARNMPLLSKAQLYVLNKANLQDILSVKLKHVNTIKQDIVYEPKHPVLCELLRKIKRVQPI
jgi:hypothetical protein